MMRAVNFLAALAFLLGISASVPLFAQATDEKAELPVTATPIQEPVSKSTPSYGIFYDRYEPTFYTGFAPRTQDPKRIHLHLGRGNQLRVTAVLSAPVLQAYARDLLARLQTYRALMKKGRLVLTQNRSFESFERVVEEAAIEDLVASEATLSPLAIRERNLELLERLNPGRVFRIRMPADEVVRRWVAQLRPEDRKTKDRKRRLELLNLMLPTRLFVPKLTPEVSAKLMALVRLALAPGTVTDAESPVGTDFFQLLEKVTHGIYPVVNGQLQFNEFTAVYPVGSLNDYTKHKGGRIPLYPTPGRRALTTHQRTKTVEHIPSIAVYSYSPWIPYMHVGKTLHNSFHTLWWKMRPQKTSFLPDSLRKTDQKSRNGKAYRYLWLLSRGPMSHGCTHVNAGHIMELRQILPSDTALLYQVDTFINKSYLFDVFDIDGDFEPEVMGVRYYVAYSLRHKRPHKLRAPMDRRAFYAWLYGGELEYDAQGRGFFRNVRDGRFIGRRAFRGATYEKIALHEVDYEPEKVQFYRMVDIPFARELRKVGADHPFSNRRRRKQS